MAVSSTADHRRTVNITRVGAPQEMNTHINHVLNLRTCPTLHLLLNTVCRTVIILKRRSATELMVLNMYYDVLQCSAESEVFRARLDSDNIQNNVVQLGY